MASIYLVLPQKKIHTINMTQKFGNPSQNMEVLLALQSARVFKKLSC